MTLSPLTFKLKNDVVTKTLLLISFFIQSFYLLTLHIDVLLLEKIIYLVTFFGKNGATPSISIISFSTLILLFQHFLLK